VNNGTIYTYYTNGLLKTKTNSIGNTTSYTYDLYGNKATETYANGAIIKYEYDSMNRVSCEYFKDINEENFVLVSKYTYATSKTTKLDYFDDYTIATTISEFDTMGRLIKQTNPDGKSITKTYYGNNLVRSSTDANGNTTEYTYDVLGNVLVEKISFENSSYQYIYFEYDKEGNLSSKKITNNLPNQSETFRTVEYVNSSRGFLLAVINYDNGYTKNVVQYYYDFEGNVLRKYTGLDSLLTITGLDIVSGESTYSLEKFEYDCFGNVLKETNANGFAQTYQYDKNSNLVRKTDRNGDTVEYTYDYGNRMLTKTSSKAGTESYSYTYDCVDNLILVVSENMTSTYTYDGKGNMLTKIENGFKNTYTYNRIGHRTSLTVETNGTIMQSLTYEYDLCGRLTALKQDDLLIASYTYDNNGNRSSLVYENGISVKYTYNKANLVKSITNIDAEQNIISTFGYEYYLDGNQASKSDLQYITNYEYDGLARLVKVSENDSTTTYLYDDNGNRKVKTQNGIVTVYDYDANNQLVAETTGSEVINYSYDKNGNTTSKSSAVTNESYEYNGYDQLILFSCNKGTYTYIYDYNGMRNSKSNGTSTIQYAWDGSNIIVEKTGSTITDYVYGINLVCAIKNNSYEFYLHNAHGDVVNITNAEGVNIREYYYSPYGIEKNLDSSDSNPYRFAGEYYDKESGNYYIKARYYNPSIGRFTCEDTFQGNNNDALSLNRYSYGHNNPIFYIDTDGHKAVSVANVLFDASNAGLRAGLNAAGKEIAKDAFFNEKLTSINKYTDIIVTNSRSGFIQSVTGSVLSYMGLNDLAPIARATKTVYTNMKTAKNSDTAFPSSGLAASFFDVSTSMSGLTGINGALMGNLMNLLKDSATSNLDNNINIRVLRRVFTNTETSKNVKAAKTYAGQKAYNSYIRKGYSSSIASVARIHASYTTALDYSSSYAESIMKNYNTSRSFWDILFGRK
ncbi:MAG: RHS repeat protein, partial [Clostridiales bacterium]|nr:RHS repeat protein [Clostridiales bacterium]